MSRTRKEEIYDCLVKIDGKIKTVEKWRKELGLSKHLVYKRIHLHGWKPIVALLTPLIRVKRINGKKEN